MNTQAEKAKSAKQLRYEREKRIVDAIELRIPDRVPIACPIGYFPAKVAGIPCSSAFYNFEAWYDAYKQVMPDYPADMIFQQGYFPGKAWEILQPKMLLWPGGGSDPNHGHQSIETDAMKADEYDAFMEDPSDYLFRIHLSRLSNNLEGLADLPKLNYLHGLMGLEIMTRAFSEPKTAKAIETLLKTGREIRRNDRKIKKFNKLLEDMGFPQYFQGVSMPPYDLISHSLRGMTGCMMDMYRKPDKVIAAAEKILEITLARPVPEPSPLGQRRVFMTVTRGSDDFLSKKMFDTFYWPTFRKLIHGLIEKGMTPCVFFEGTFNTRMEYLLDFPKGKMLARIDASDIFKAKEILKDHVCLEGNVPSTILQVGTVDDVKEYCKKLIDVVGKDGGFILSPRSSTDEVKAENLKAMIDFTHEYGVYR
jgi:uroporphyrinogen-III decarboxylase